jgi:uncharacterized protein (DUF1800 family)
MRHLLLVLMACALAACGGGGGGSTGGGSIGGGSTSGGSTGGGSTGGGSTGGGTTIKPTAVEAVRLLTQASFGPTDASIAEVTNSATVADWVNTQMAAPVPAQSHVAYIDTQQTAQGSVSANDFYEGWWRQATTEPGQLRQRVAFALSQVFVISLVDGAIDTRGAAAYYDMLERDAFSNFRTLLEDVTLHPMMGRYLTYLGNQKEDTAGTRTRDENYAREVMQLMTIGLTELNADGSNRTDSAGAAIATYTPADIAGLAKVFTGLSWYAPVPSNTTFGGGNPDPDRSIRPMSIYNAFHSTSAKTFLGLTIPASATPDTAGDLRLALDHLFNHANVGPFIARRLIQQLVTSNPSPSYITRISAVFANNGQGVRGDMAAVVRAILTDPEARIAPGAADFTFGKLREPVIRLANWARTFKATSQSGQWLITSTSASTSLGQSPLTSSSVFNFWRPGYVPPATTETGARNLNAPEFQIVDEVTTASYVNAMQTWIDAGVGSTPPGGTGRDVLATYADELTIADDSQKLVDRMNLLLFYGGMSATLQARVKAGVDAIAIPAATATNQATVNTAKLNRVKTAIFFSMISPEYLIQR